MIKKTFYVIVLFVIVTVVFTGIYFWNQITWSVSASEEVVNFTVTEGEGVKSIAGNLIEAGLIRSQYWFEMYVFVDRSQTSFIAGTYALKPSMNVREIVRTMTNAETAPEETITLIEGWSNTEIAEYLDANGTVPKSDFLTAASASDSRTLIPAKQYAILDDKPAAADLEGYLFPDTYRIYKNSTPAEIIEKLLDNFEVKFTSQMRADAASRQMSIYQIVTLASIIEKEVRTDTDRKIAAGIFYDRINSGVALQSDATVNFVTGKQALQPTTSDTEIDNPYNTYQYRGLPPGPICNPSLSAIMAAIYPEQSDYVYFLTKPDGSTVFSATYEEHLANKKKYLQ